MGEAAESGSSGMKTVQVDPATLAIGGSSGRRRRPSARARTDKSGGGAPVTSGDIAARSAVLQQAVESALAAAANATHAKQQTGGGGAGVSSGDIKTVSSTLDGSSIVPNTHPRSISSVSAAVQELTRLMKERHAARIQKTVRAEHRRGKDLISGTRSAGVENGIPIMAGSTAARCPNAPPWGCLKGGRMPTYRVYKTQRAGGQASTPRRVRMSQAHEPTLNRDVQPPAASSPVRAPTLEPTPQPRQPTAVTTPKQGATVSVGRQRNGRVAFVIGDGANKTRRRTANAPSQRRSITSRAKLRKAHLLRGGSNTPQRLVDVMVRSVESIGDVVRPMPSS